MAVSTENETGIVRLLGLGNEILADDAFGILAALTVEMSFIPAMRVLMSPPSARQTEREKREEAQPGSTGHEVNPLQQRVDAWMGDNGLLDDVPAVARAVP